MTESTYRRKALSHLLKDFESRCAYCLKLLTVSPLNQTNVDHFDAQLKAKRRHQYKNLMLACSACNLTKHFKPVKNPLRAEQHLLNCTELTEFPTHIVENSHGQWIPRTEAGMYHIASIDLNEQSHVTARVDRRRLAAQVDRIRKNPMYYTGAMDGASLKQITDLLETVEVQLKKSIPPIPSSDSV